MTASLPSLAQAAIVPSAPAPCDQFATATPFLTLTEPITEADSGFSGGSGGDWALDTFTEDVSVWLGTDGTTFCAMGTTDGAKFVTTGPKTPEQGSALAAGITGTFTGGETWVFPAGTATTTSATSLTLAADNSNQDSQFSNWQLQVFGQKTPVSTYSFTYVTDASSTDTWTDAGTGDSGDITDPSMSAVYVDASAGNDSNIGSSAYPFKTIQAAVNAVTAGGTVNVRTGTYAENVTIPTGITLTGASAAGTTIDGEVTINASSTSVSGFTISNPNGNAGILINGVGNVTVSNDIVTNIGTGTATGNVDGIYYQDGSSDASGVTISNNTVTNIGSTSNGSNDGIGIGDSTGTANLTGFVISGNTISNVTASASKGVDGIQLNHASGVSGNTGTTANAQLTNNVISNLSGAWVYGIGLEGNTPGATVTGNTFSNETGSPYPAVAIFFQSDAGASSVSLSDNSLDTSTVALGVAAYSDITGTIDASKNYWNTGTASPSSKTGVLSPGTALINVSPWYTDAAMTTLSGGVSLDNGTNATSTIVDAIATSTGSVSIDIPAGTVVTGPSGWDGTIELPQVLTTTVAPTPDSGFTASAVLSIEVGSSTAALTLNTPAEIVFTGKAGDSVGWSRNGSFTPITAVCDSATAPTLAAGADCKVNNDGNGNLIVWTKHFTTFTAYTQTAIPVTTTVSSGGGGNGPIVVASSAPAASTPSITGSVLGASTAPGSAGTSGTTDQNGEVLGASVYNFTVNFGVGTRDTDVTQLQTQLTTDGFYTGPITGYFGPLTKAAVEKFQTAKGIFASGYVGTLTRGVLNEGTSPTLLQELQSELEAMMAKLNAMQSASSTAATSTAMTSTAAMTTAATTTMMLVTPMATSTAATSTAATSTAQ